MNEGYIKKGLYDAIASVAGTTVVWADQSGPRPARPYVTIKILTGPTREGHDVEQMAHYPGEDEDPAVDSMEISGHRLLSLSVNFLGEKALEGMARIQSRLQWPSTRETLSRKNLVYVSDSGVRDLSQALETQTETRSQMDLVFRFLDQQTDEGVGWIESVTVENEDTEDVLNIP